MSATDELRRLLDERGVEWESKDVEGIPGFHDTRWNAYDVRWCYVEFVGNNYTKLVPSSEFHCTPEQAIAATLGSGTCENVNTDGYGFYFECSECGYSTIVHNCAIRLDELPKLCPECGCKVVGE